MFPTCNILPLLTYAVSNACFDLSLLSALWPCELRHCRCSCGWAAAVPGYHLRFGDNKVL